MNVHKKIYYCALLLGMQPASGMSLWRKLTGINESLQSAAWEGDIKKVRQALALGADVNAQDSNGWTPLLHAVHWQGRNRYLIVEGEETDLIWLLLANGAKKSIDQQNNDGLNALQYAIKYNSVSVALLLLQNGAHPNPYKKPLLPLAYRSPEMIDLLIRYGANINARNSDGKTALMLAADSNKAESVKMLLDKGADPDLKFNGNSAEDLALDTTTKKIFEDFRKQQLIEKEVPVGQVFQKMGLNKPGLKGVQNIIRAQAGIPNEKLNKSLAIAAASGDLFKIKELLAQGATPNWDAGSTKAFYIHFKDDPTTCVIRGPGAPLQAAVWFDKADAVQLLMPASSSISKQLALETAIKRCHIESLKILLRDPDIDVDSTRLGRIVPTYHLLVACPAAIPLLLQAGANPFLQHPPHNLTVYQLAATNIVKLFDEFNERNKKLLGAVTTQEHAQVQHLLEQGVRMDVTNEEGDTPLILAAEQGDIPLLKMLLNAMAKGRYKKDKTVNAQNKLGTTALIRAIMNNKPEAVRMLLAAGANPRLADGNGRNAFAHAKEHKIMSQLLEKYVQEPVAGAQL